MSSKIFASVARAVDSVAMKAPSVLFSGECADLMRHLPADSIDLTVTSPPYCMGKEYEDGRSTDDFRSLHREILPEIVRLTKPRGNICWQVGYHVNNGNVTPLDYIVMDLMKDYPGLKLRNRIIWEFGHGPHGSRRFSGRHEIILWFSNGDGHYFDLDAVRIPQKYPGKRHYKGPNKGSWSGNPKGKNPGDVWEIPNVKASHVEKTDHPCQYPVALVQRLVKALCPKGGLVFDPFMGSGTTGVSALIEGRRFVGAELSKQYISTAKERIVAAEAGRAIYRSLDKPIYTPGPNDAVAFAPPHFYTGS